MRFFSRNGQSWGINKNWLELKTKPSYPLISLSKSLKCTLEKFDCTPSCIFLVKKVSISIFGITKKNHFHGTPVGSLFSSTKGFEMLHSKLPTMTSIPIPPKKWLKSRIHYYKFQKKLLLHFEQTAILVKVTQVVQWWFARDSTLGFKLELSAMDWRFVFQFAKMDRPKMTLGVIQITRDTLEEGVGGRG